MVSPLQLNVVKMSDCIGPAFYEIYRLIRDQEIALEQGQELTNQIYELWLTGGRGSLKSSFASILIARGLKTYPDAHAIILRRWENDLNDSVFSQMKWAFDMVGTYHEWQFITRPMRARNNKTGQVVIFKGGDDPIKLKSLKIPRGYVKYLWNEEVNQFRGPEDLRNIEQSVFRGEKSNRTLSINSYNPPKSEREWVNKEVRLKVPGRFVHESNYLQAPQEWLGKRFFIKANTLKELNLAAYENEYMGKITGTGNEVFKNIKSVQFDKAELDAMTNVRQGLDWGYSINPLSLVRTSYDARRNVLRIFDEIFQLGWGNPELDDRADLEWKRITTYGDSAEPKSCDEMRKYEWKLVNSYKPKNSVRQGIKWLQNLAAIEIDMVRCPNTLNQFLQYNYTLTPDGKTLDDFPDKENDAIDATRYSQQENIFILNQDTNIKLSTNGVKSYWSKQYAP